MKTATVIWQRGKTVSDIVGKEFVVVATTEDGDYTTVRELIRCIDCKYWLKTKKQCGNTYLLPHFEAGEFCSRAERKKNDTDKR